MNIYCEYNKEGSDNYRSLLCGLYMPSLCILYGNSIITGNQPNTQNYIGGDLPNYYHVFSRGNSNGNNGRRYTVLAARYIKYIIDNH